MATLPTTGTGWRRELDDCEVAESYMDAKSEGEGADTAEIVAG